MRIILAIAAFLLTAATGCITVVQPPASQSAQPAGAEPAAASLPTIEAFSASPETIAAGKSSTLNWNVKNATSVMIAPDVGSVSATGSKEVKPSATASYVLTASNAAGTNYSQVTVNVTVARITPGAFRVLQDVVPKIESFSASPETISKGASSTLSWSVKNANSIMIVPEIGSVSATGSKAVKPSSSTMYTLIAGNASGMSSQPLTVSVLSFEKVGNLQLSVVQKPDLTLWFGIGPGVDNGAVFYTMQNAGQGNSVPCTNDLYIDGVKVRTDYIGVILPPKAILTRTMYMNLTETPEKHVFEVRLDTNNKNEESNENNNSASRSFNYKQ